MELVITVDPLGADIDGAAVAHALELVSAGDQHRYFRTIRMGLAVSGRRRHLPPSASSKRQDWPFAARSTISPRSICQVAGPNRHAIA